MSVNAENFSEFPKIVKRFSSALKGISLFPYLRFIVGIKEIYHYPKQPQKSSKGRNGTRIYAERARTGTDKSIQNKILNIEF